MFGKIFVGQAGGWERGSGHCESQPRERGQGERELGGRDQSQREVGLEGGGNFKL